MKKILFAFALILMFNNLNAQSFRIGVTGAYNSTWMFNKNVSDAGDELDYKSSFGGQFGIEALYNFKESIGVSIGILSNGINQKYTHRDPDFEDQAKVKYIAVPLLFRYTSEKGPYFEVGPEFSFGGKFKYELDGDEVELPGDDGDYVSSSNISFAIGFGVDIKASEKIIIPIGLRFAWGLSDISKPTDEGQDGYEPTNSAVGGIHIGVAYLISSKE